MTEGFTMMAFKRILVPFDFSETSAAAVNYAVDIAKKFGANLAFIYVGDRTGAEAVAESGIVTSGEREVDAATRGSLLQMLSPADRASLNPQFYVRTGDPAEEIVQLASDHDIDLIVMGTHGRGFVGHLVMGSVAERVVRTAPCPVLTVRNPAHPVAHVEVVPEAAIAARAI
jgi:nucleotide-binding universal stress UspA family protein